MTSAPPAARFPLAVRSLAAALLILASVGPRSAFSQPAFPMTLPYDIPNVRDAAVDFGDLDGDGDLDMAVVGQNFRELIVRVYRLMDIAHFAGDVKLNPAKDVREISFSGRSVIHGEVRWGDYDADGDADLLITGLHESFQQGAVRRVPVLDVYHNVGQHGQNAWFAPRMELAGLYRSSADWGDYDGDGDLDILASGLPEVGSTEPVTRVYVNEGASFRLVPTDIPGTVSGDVAWADYDADGLADAAVMGDTGRGVFVTKVYRNTGSGFVDSGLAIPGLAYGSLSWGDYDADGDPDLLLTGGRLDPRFLRGVTKIYRNDEGILTEIDVALPGWTLGQVRWGDADIDGDLDLFALGVTAPLEGPVLHVFANDGGAFGELWRLTGTRFGSLAVADYNGDGDADVAFTGILAGEELFKFFSNRVYPECLLSDWVPQGQSAGDCFP